jgi:hypothetical protein
MLIQVPVSSKQQLCLQGELLWCQHSTLQLLHDAAQMDGAGWQTTAQFMIMSALLAMVCAGARHHPGAQDNMARCAAAAAAASTLQCKACTGWAACGSDQNSTQRAHACCWSSRVRTAASQMLVWYFVLECVVCCCCVCRRLVALRLQYWLLSCSKCCSKHHMTRRCAVLLLLLQAPRTTC